MNRLPSLLLVLCIATSATNAARGEDTVDYLKQIKPLLREHCYGCHGPDQQESELRLDTVALALEGGNLGAAIKPGKADESLLLAVVQGASDEIPRMPPEDEADALPAASIALIKRWIDQGAKHPKDEEPAARSAKASTHWSFQPLSPALPPASSDAWIRNGIDAFILARLAKHNLRPSEPASRTVLLRRLHLDLLGLPPSREAVDAFLKDDRPDAFEREVDRLLASPQYGERWGRHWLDLARYADSDGYTNDVARVMWRYRDWVIDAVNRGQPFDEFVMDQIAGDLRTAPSHEQIVATGFHRNTQRNREGGSDAEQYRVEAVVDRVSTTGVVFLGLTLGCARCHDHKYDPISQREFYQLFAFLNNQDEPQISSPLDTIERFQLVETQRERKQLEAGLKELDKQLASQQRAWELAQTKSAVNWRVLQNGKLTSQNGATLTSLEDGSVLVGGNLPKTDIYTLEFEAQLPNISAIRLEVLTHDSLPGGGPGLAGNGNFVLHEVQLEAVDQAAFERLEFATADADHSQPNYPIAHAIDGDAKTGWAINVKDKRDLHHNRTAILTLKKSIEKAKRLRLRLVHNQDTYLVGRFRLSVTDAKRESIALADDQLQHALAVPPQKRDDKQRKLLRDAFLQRNVERRALVERLAAVKKREAALSRRATTTTLVMRERSKPRETFIHIRGDFLRKGKPVQADTPRVLPALQLAKDARANRLDLARWLVSPEQPLTPRVTVNRIWQQLFGVGIVETENDFGLQGSPPSHPELLDWLARQFVASGWSTKRLHRLIVTSATYRQASHDRPELKDIDANNRLLAKQNRLRLEAEAIRDSALLVSGLLSTRMKGPSVFPPQPAGVMKMTRNPNRKWNVSGGENRFRRGMYTYFWRSTPHPFLKLFNAPETNTTCTRRDRSNTPLQALTLLNDEAFVEAAYALAGQILDEPGADGERLDRACRTCLNRPPTPEEKAALLDLVAAERQEGGSEFAKAPEQYRRWLAKDVVHSEAAAWIAVARVLLNLDEFITRE